MAEHAGLLLNKVVEENDINALTRFNVTSDDMHTETDRKAYRFITDYAEHNDGNAPSYATVINHVEEFQHVPEVTDSYRYLATQLKDFSAKKAIVELFQTGEFEAKLNEMSGKEFVGSWLPSVIDSVNMRTRVREKVGTDIKTDGKKFLEEYERRKTGESFKVWRSKFSAIGEYISSNVYTVFGESGRGKSIFTLEDAVHIAQQGANVLIWAMEMGWFEVMVRIYTSLSGDLSVLKAWHEGQQIDAGFNARDMRVGDLPEDVEEEFRTFLDNIDDYIEGNIVVRAVDDEDFTDRSLKALESDIEITNADFIVIDPFYYLHYERNTSRTTGGDAANTSMRLRALTGRLDVVTVAITQSDVKKSEEDEESGTRELRLPERDGVKKTAALMEDAAVLIGIDSNYKQGLGIVGNLKGRDGGEGDISNVLYLPQFGRVDELEVGEEAMKGFDF